MTCTCQARRAHRQEAQSVALLAVLRVAVSGKKFHNAMRACTTVKIEGRRKLAKLIQRQKSIREQASPRCGAMRLLSGLCAPSLRLCGRSPASHATRCMEGRIAANRCQMCPSKASAGSGVRYCAVLDVLVGDASCSGSSGSSAAISCSAACRSLQCIAQAAKVNFRNL